MCFSQSISVLQVPSWTGLLVEVMKNKNILTNRLSVLLSPMTLCSWEKPISFLGLGPGSSFLFFFFPFLLGGG